MATSQSWPVVTVIRIEDKLSRQPTILQISDAFIDSADLDGAGD
jgi:hypothetical protein